MKAKIKKDLNAIVDSIVGDYNQALTADRGVVLGNIIKGVNIIKEIENQDVENQIKRINVKLAEEKLQLEKDKMNLEMRRLEMDQAKLENEQDKFKVTVDNDIRKLELEDSKLEFEKSKFNIEWRKFKADKIFNGIMKGLEVAIPVIAGTWLSILSLKAIYKDDSRIPSETWSFIRSTFKK